MNKPLALKGYTENNGEPLEILLEDYCPECTRGESGYGDGSTSYSLIVPNKKRQYDWSYLPYGVKNECKRCGGTNLIENESGRAIMQLIQKQINLKQCNTESA